MERVLQFVRKEWLFLAFLVFVSGCSVYQLTEVPPTWYDEGMIVQLAMNVAEHGVLGTQVAPGVFLSGAFTTTAFPVVAPVALSFKLFGASLLVARSVMVLYILLFFCAAYYFLRQITSRTEALFALGLLATFSTLYATGKNVLGEVPGLFYFIVFLIFAHKIFDEGKSTKKNAIIAGLSAGLCLVTKPTFLVVGGAIILALLYKHFVQREQISLPILGYGVVAALVPLMVWLVTQFNWGDSFSAILSFYTNPYQLGNIPSVIYHNALRFFTESTPLYLFGMLVVLTASVGVRLRRKVEISFTEMVALSFAVLILLAYLRTPGWYRYLFPAQIIATLFFPSALGYCAEFFSSFKYVLFVRRSALVLLVGMVGLQGYLFFFHSWIAQYSGGDKTQMLQEYFKTIDSHKTVFVYDVPEVPLFLPQGTSYYQYISIGRGTHGLGADEISVIAAKVPEILIVPDEQKSSFPGYHETDVVKGVLVLSRNR